MLNNLLVDLVLSHLLLRDGVLVGRLPIVILKSLVTVHRRHLLLIRVHHVRVVVALKHALLKTLLSQLRGGHAVVSKTWHLRRVAGVESRHLPHLRVVDTLRRVIIITSMKLIRIINSTRVGHQMGGHAHVLLTVVLVGVHRHAVSHVEAWLLPLHVLGVSVVLVVVLHLIN